MIVGDTLDNYGKDVNVYRLCRIIALLGSLLLTGYFCITRSSFCGIQVNVYNCNVLKFWK